MGLCGGQDLGVDRVIGDDAMLVFVRVLDKPHLDVEPCSRELRLFIFQSTPL